MKICPLTRRLFLQGVGKNLLAVPFLPSLAKAEENYSAQPRLIYAISRNGQRASEFFPQLPDSALSVYNGQNDVRYTALSSLSGAVSPIIDARFNPFKNKFSLLYGLDVPAGGDHSNHMPLTAALGGLGGVPSTPYSICTVLENSPKIYPKTPKFGALRLCPNLADRSTSYGWTKIGGVAVQMPGIASDVKLFQQLFGGAQSEQQTSFLNRSNGLIIDNLLADHNQLLQSNKLSALDKSKLQHYFDTLRDLQTRMQVTYASCQAPSLRTGTQSDLTQLYENHFDMAVMALACSHTRIVGINIEHFKASPNQNSSEWHETSHSREAAAITRSTEWERWIAGLVLSLMNKLDAVTDGNGSLLDNSLLYWGNETAVGDWHRAHSMPVFIAGGGAGTVKPGYLVDYRPRPFQYYADRGDFGATGRLYHQFLTSLMTVMGLSPADYQFDQNATLGGFGDYTLGGYNAQSLWGRYVTQRNQPKLPFYCS